MLGFGIGGFTLGRPASGGPYAGLTRISSFHSDISDSYWFKKNVTIAAGAADPRGGTTAERMLETAVTDTHEVSQNGVLDLVLGSRYVLEAVVKPVGVRHVHIALYDGAFANGHGQDFNLTTGAVGAVSVSFGTIVSSPVASISPAGNGYFRCRIRFTAAANVINGNFYWTAQITPTVAFYLGEVDKGLDFDSLGLYQVA